MNKSLQKLIAQSKIMRALGLLLLLTAWMPMQSVAQTKEYVNSISYISGGSNWVINPNRVLVGQNGNTENDFAIVKSNRVLLVGSNSGVLEQEFNVVLPAGTTSYLRIGHEDVDILKSLLGGTLGKVLSGAIGNLLGRNYFDIEVRNNEGSLLKVGSSQNGLDVTDYGSVELVQDDKGNYLLAITPTVTYNRIRFSAKTGVGIGSSQSIDIYGAYYYTGESACTPVLTTSYDGAGVKVELLNNGETGVFNAGNAIDGNVDSYSEIKSGGLINVNLLGYYSQIINYSTLSEQNSHIKLKMSIQSNDILDVGVLSNYEVIAYNGSTEVFRSNLAQGLLAGTDILGLLGNNQVNTFTFSPTDKFDKVEIRVGVVLNLGVATNGVRIYDIKRFGPIGSSCADPDLTFPDATETPFENPSCEATIVDSKYANFAYLAADGNNETYATLNASSGALLGINSYSGFLEYEFPTAIPANKTTYIRIDMDGNLLGRLVSGTLGALVDNVGGLLLGDHYFTVEAKTAQTGGTSVLNGSSAVGFSGTTGGDLRIVQDNIGRYYIAVTPNQPYKNIKITEHFPALIGAQEGATMKIFEACFEIGENACLDAQFTSFDQAGLSLGLLNGAGVKDADHAISGNSSDYSEISTGTVAIAGQVAQRIYFNKLSTVGDELKVRLQMDPSSLASVDLLGNYKIVTYNGSTVAETFTLQQGLINNLNLLDLFKSGGIQTLTYETTKVYDRVDVVVGSLVNVALSPALRLYEVKRIGAGCPETTTPSPFENPTCATKLLDASNADDVQNLFDDDFDSYATLKSGAGLLLGLGNQYEGFVELGFDTPVPADKTAYIRIDYEPTLLNALLGGSLGGALANLVDGLLLGNHYFSVEVKNGVTSLFTASSNNGFSDNTEKVRIIQDAAGRYYIAVTAGVPYTSIKITDHTNSALGLLAQPNTMNVYGVCFDSPIDACAPVFGTSYDGSGITLDVAGISGVKNADHAIDANTTNFSEISLGTVAVAGSIKQIIFFNQLAKATDVVKIKLATGAGAVDLALLGNFEIKAYKGAVEVAKLDWNNGLINGINVLNLLNTGNPTEIPFRPGVPFDRISVGINTLLQASVMPNLKLYDVIKDCTVIASEFVSWKTADQTNVKGGEEVDYTIHVRNTGAVDIHNMTIEDKLPANTTYVSGGTFADGKVTFPALDVLVGETKTVTFKVKVNNDLTGVTEIRNIATVNGVETFPSLPNDPNEPDTNAVPGTSIPVDQVKSVVSWKAYTIGENDKTSTTVSGGEEVKYHIYVRNTGNQDLTNVVVTDVLPEGVIWKSGGTHANGEVTFTIPNLKVGATSSALNFTVTVDKDLTNISEISNIAVVKPDANETDEFESFPPVDNTNPTEPDENTTLGTVLEVTPKHDVEISKVGVSNNATNNGQAQIGDEVTYTITVKNTGNKALEALTITDVLPANFKDVATQNQEGSVAGNTVTFQLPTLTVNEVKTLVITAIVESIDDLTDNKIVNTAEVTYRNEADDGDKTETATHEMNTSCIAINAGDITITTDKQTVCAEDTFTITASSSINGLVDPVFRWYTNADLSGMPTIGDALLTSVTETTTFYVTLEADGYCFNTPPQEITITVEPEAGIPTITASGDITDVCLGETVTLTATATDADSYQWYKDGVDITGATTDTYNVTETGSYTVTALNTTGCDSDPSAAVEVSFLPTAVATDIEIDAPEVVCQNEEVTLKASLSTTSQTISNPVFKWYLDAALTELVYEGEEFSLIASAEMVGTHTLYVTVEGDGVCANTNDAATHTITVNPAPKLTIDGSQMIYVATGATITWPAATTDFGSIAWYDSNEVEVTNNLPNSFASVGVYTYTIVAIHNDCYSFETVIVNVYDADACPPAMERVYATKSSSWGSIITGGVSHKDNAVDGNPKTHSTITTGVGLLGIGTTWQNIYFDHEVPAGTPVTIKLGKEYSGVMLAGGLSVQGLDHSGKTIGGLQTVAGGLLDLLVADNVVEFTFVPSERSGPKAYHGVRVSQGALVSVAQNAKVYGAYYSRPATGQISCEPVVSDVKPYVQDVLYGVEDLSLGVASSLASVINPWNAVDGNMTTATIMNRAVSALNFATLTIVFKDQVMPTDEIQLTMEDPSSTGLSLDLITGYRFQRYNGNIAVGEPIEGLNVLDLRLLTFTNDKIGLIVGSFDEPYDRIKISFGSLVQLNLGDQVKIYDVSVIPALDYGQIDGEDFEICAGGDLELENQDDCTIYEVYTTEAGTDKLTTTDGFTFQLPTDVNPGENKFYVQAIREGCPIGSRQEIKVIVNPAPVLEQILINGNLSIFETTIDASPGEVIEVKPIVNWNNSTPKEWVWEMENPETPGEWISIPFAQVENEGTIKFSIPDFGSITLPDDTVVDIRNTEVKIRLTLESDKGCITIEEGLILKIDGKSQLIVNPNITNKLKN